MFEIEITLPGIRKLQEQGNTAQYEVAPLEPGYGATVGQPLQRVLRSSLPGAAVTSIKIEGAKRIDQRLPGVREDVSEIVLNVKRLRLRCFADHPVTMSLQVSGARVVTAADIVAPSTVEIMNPELEIVTLDHKHTQLDMELAVETGRGYVPADLQEDQPIGLIAVDAIYTPVIKAEYRIEHTRVGKWVNYERVLLELQTDGTISPDEALRLSGEILQHQFMQLTEYRQSTLAEQRKKAATNSNLLIPPQIYDLPLEALSLPPRTHNSLKRNGHITKTGQILEQDDEGLLGIRNIGVKALQEIRERLLATGCLPAFAEPMPSSESTFSEEM
jgi:DNA-directed RNA polymerase subunit alpha